MARHINNFFFFGNAYKILLRNLKGRDHLEDPGTDKKINIRMDLKEIVWVGVDWMHLAQHRDQWQALVKKVMNLQVP
jgi:hypothetical protein